MIALLFLAVALLFATLTLRIGEPVLTFVRARLAAGRKGLPRGRIFAAFFWAYTVALIVWLVAGLAPAIVRASPSLHEKLHASSGTTRPLRVTMSDYTFDQQRLVAPAWAPLTFSMVNNHRGVEHNIAVYRVEYGLKPATSYDTIDVLELSSRGIVGPVTREFSFAGLPPGTYAFRCDIEDPSPEIGNHARYMYGDLVVEPAAFTDAGSGPWMTARRGLANAFHYSGGIGQVIPDYVFSLLALGLGVFLVSKRRMDRVARLFGVGMLGTAAAYNIQSHAALDVVPSVASILHPVFVHLVSGIAYVYAVVLFPDGRLLPAISDPWKRAMYRAITFVAILVAAGAVGLVEPSPGRGHATAFVQAFGILIPAVGVVAQSYRYRIALTPEARQQSKLLLWAFAPALLFGVTVVLLRTLSGTEGFSGPRESELETFAFRLYQPVFIVIPIALIVGILRHRMWDFDVVVNKAIVSGVLVAFVGAAYVSVVVGFGQLAGARSTPALAVATMVLVAVAFEPLRVRVRQFANRLVFGRRATPYQALAEFSRSLASAVSAGDVLPRIAEAAAHGVGAARTRATIALPGGGSRSVDWPAGGNGASFDRVVPASHLGELVGELAIAKPPGEPLTAEDERTLAALAHQAGLAMHSVLLTEQLHARLATLSAQAKDLALSRLRIVTAQDEERRALQREIDEGVVAELKKMRRSFAAIEATMRTDPGAAARKLEAAGERAASALETLREVARGIYPPLLADKGILAAIEAQLRRMPDVVRLQAAPSLEGARFDPHVEAAVYFCCVEALRAARGQDGARLKLSHRNGFVQFSIGPVAGRDGLLDRMRDRVEAASGSIEERGGIVKGRVPAQRRSAASHAAVSVSGPSSDLAR